MQSEGRAMRFLELSEILLRSFEVEGRHEESIGIATLCIERCQQVASSRVYRRLVRIVLLPYLSLSTYPHDKALRALLRRLWGICDSDGLAEDRLLGWARTQDLVANLGVLVPKYFKNMDPWW